MIAKIDLNGKWQVRWADGFRGRPEYAEREDIDASRYIEARVPGEIHLDAMRAGWIEDPRTGLNCLAARWVEENVWSYRREFEVSDAQCGGAAWLVFEGLDIAARIVLNGREIARHQNVFYPCRVRVDGILRPGKNILAVHLESGLYATAEKPITGYSTVISDHLGKRQWLRKPQCQFGWDWSTRLLNVGIVKPVYLEFAHDNLRIDRLVPLATVSDDLNNAKVEIRQFIENAGETEITVELCASLPELGISAQTIVAIPPGINRANCQIELKNPELWWPVGHGKPKLYQLEVTVKYNGEIIGANSAKIGFRHIRINQSPHPESGTYFIVEVNRRKIFLKGGNFVPADMILAAIDRARYEKLVDEALAANFNSLRVWGGGLYEADEFYELCDERGILVWQEFIFACGRYPAFDQSFHDDFIHEATYNIRRLAAHPSLIIWCGNNEMEWGNWHWGYDKGMVYPDYALFHLTIPRLLAQEDHTRYYQPSSPFSPGGADPTRNDTGDQHPWSIGFRDTDFRKYRDMVCRFPNEGGILGPTALPTILACLPEGQRYHGSFAWQVHDNSIDSWSEPSPPDEMLRQWLGLDPAALTPAEFAFWGGLVQGEGLREYIDNFRHRMFDCAAAIFWMYNDCWPAVRSWTIIDYYLRRTPAFHFVRRAMAPVSVVLVKSAQKITVYGINDTPQAVSGDLRFGIFKLSGGYPADHQLAVVMPENSSSVLASFDDDGDERGSMAFATFSVAGAIVARNRLFMPRFHELEFAPADIRCRIENGEAIFECDVFAWGVCLDLEGNSELNDNFFDLYPGMPHRIPWHDGKTVEIVNVGNKLAETLKNQV